MGEVIISHKGKRAVVLIVMIPTSVRIVYSDNDTDDDEDENCIVIKAQEDSEKEEEVQIDQTEVFSMKLDNVMFYSTNNPTAILQYTGPRTLKEEANESDTSEELGSYTASDTEEESAASGNCSEFSSNTEESTDHEEFPKIFTIDPQNMNSETNSEFELKQQGKLLEGNEALDNNSAQKKKRQRKRKRKKKIKKDYSFLDDVIVPTTKKKKVKKSEKPKNNGAATGTATALPKKPVVAKQKTRRRSKANNSSDDDSLWSRKQIVSPPAASEGTVSTVLDSRGSIGTENGNRDFNSRSNRVEQSTQYPGASQFIGDSRNAPVREHFSKNLPSSRIIHYASTRNQIEENNQFPVASHGGWPVNQDQSDLGRPAPSRRGRKGRGSSHKERGSLHGYNPSLGRNRNDDRASNKRNFERKGQHANDNYMPPATAPPVTTPSSTKTMMELANENLNTNISPPGISRPPGYPLPPRGEYPHDYPYYYSRGEYSGEYGAGYEYPRHSIEHDVPPPKTSPRRAPGPYIHPSRRSLTSSVPLDDPSYANAPMDDRTSPRAPYKPNRIPEPEFNSGYYGDYSRYSKNDSYQRDYPYDSHPRSSAHRGSAPWEGENSYSHYGRGHEYPYSSYQGMSQSMGAYYRKDYPPQNFYNRQGEPSYQNHSHSSHSPSPLYNNQDSNSLRNSNSWTHQPSRAPQHPPHSSFPNSQHDSQEKSDSRASSMDWAVMEPSPKRQRTSVSPEPPKVSGTKASSEPPSPTRSREPSPKQQSKIKSSPRSPLPLLPVKGLESPEHKSPKPKSEKVKIHSSKRNTSSSDTNSKQRNLCKKFCSDTVIKIVTLYNRDEKLEKEEFKRICRKLTHAVLEKEARNNYVISEATGVKIHKFVDQYFCSNQKYKSHPRVRKLKKK